MHKGVGAIARLNVEKYPLGEGAPTGRAHTHTHLNDAIRKVECSR